MMILDKPDAKFRLIREMLSQEGNILTVTDMCGIAGVSRSGYYRWLAAAGARGRREAMDKGDFELVLAAYRHRGYAKGARGIHMRLLRNDPPAVMNLKKIRRLMRKYGLFCPIRKANPYRRMARAMQTGSRAPNLLRREFTKHGPRKVLLTDITYIPLGGAFCYLSVVMDAFTRQALSHALSDSLEVDFVLETVRSLVERHGISLSDETMIHSDQGCHYTSRSFIQITQDAELRRSMSRRGNCWDNAPQESFFGHMKDEVDISGCRTFADVRAAIDDWIDYYNTERYQWQLAKLSPDEYYLYATTGVYPLPLPAPAMESGVTPL
jgi:transposase InsO family protein